MPADALSATLSALADPTRRGILARLAIGDATVQDLAAPYDMSLAAVSKHLKVLANAGLISRGREAQWRPCHLEGEPMAAVSEWLADYRRFWDRSLDGLAQYLKGMGGAPPGPARTAKRRPARGSAGALGGGARKPSSNSGRNAKHRPRK